MNRHLAEKLFLLKRKLIDEITAVEGALNNPHDVCQHCSYGLASTLYEKKSCLERELHDIKDIINLHWNGDK